MAEKKLAEIKENEQKLKKEALEVVEPSTCDVTEQLPEDQTISAKTVPDEAELKTKTDEVEVESIENAGNQVLE